MNLRLWQDVRSHAWACIVTLSLLSLQAIASTTANSQLVSSQASKAAAQAYRQAQQLGQSDKSGAAFAPATAANGLQIIGNFSYQISGNAVTINVDTIQNNSGTRTTGTLRLELWATTSAPSREAAFNGYKLAVSTTFNPLSPGYYYSNIIRTTGLTAPPDGTYWIVLVLSEFDSVNCPTADHFCIADTGIFQNQQTFGAAPPPSTFYTIISYVGSQCYQNYSSAAWDLLQQSSPGLFQQFASTTTCASLGMAVFAGYLGGDTSIPVYTTDIASAQFLCSTGLLTGCTSPPSGTVDAVEYYYAAWNYYFVTASADEIAVLDNGAFGGVWRRTGQTFKVWPQSAGVGFATCRFFSIGFPPKSTHFYTPFAAECNGLKSDPNWQYETIAFYLQLANTNGLCAAGTVPLYRLFNNFMGGAPNHRYTTSATIFNQMIAAGWTFEGNETTKVFACVPQ